MRKLAAIFFLVVFAAASTEFGQLLKFPFLVQHYYTHQQESPMTLLDFLFEHYGREHHDADRQEDMQLPFKMPVQSPVTTACLSHQEFEVGQPLPFPAEQPFSFQTLFIPSSHVLQIFHPPRMV